MSNTCSNCSYYVQGDMRCDYDRSVTYHSHGFSCVHHRPVGQNEDEKLDEKLKRLRAQAIIKGMGLKTTDEINEEIANRRAGSDCMESHENGGDCELECNSDKPGTCPDFEWTELEQGKKFDDGKLRLDLLPIEALSDIADVLTYGANKYGEHNWERGIVYHRLYGAALRHMFAWWLREDEDQETGLSHLAHAACNLCFLMWNEYHRQDLDDRPKYGDKGEE